jgi:putative mRNA 3-end processing factor
LDGSGFNIWRDGMGNKISKIFLDYPEYLRSAPRLKRSLGKMKVIHSSEDRKKAIKGEVILTTSGMLDGGPVLWYINKMKDDPRSAILLTGYQVEGTNGRNLLENGIVNIRGVNQKVNCEINYFDFSAHAGHSELVKFVRDCHPEEVIIFHSDNADPLAKEIENFAQVRLPNGKMEL